MARNKGLPPAVGVLWLLNALIFGAAAAFTHGANRLLLGLVALGWLLWGGGLLARSRYPVQAPRWASWGTWITLGSALLLVVWKVLRLIAFGG